MKTKYGFWNNLGYVLRGMKKWGDKLISLRIVGIIAGVLFYPISQKVQKIRYPSIIKRLNTKN